MTMKIDVYCYDGSPLGLTVDNIYSTGVGGAELSLLTWAEVMAGRGHLVRIYNNPPMGHTYDGPVEFRPQRDFLRQEPGRDALIAFRSPNQWMKFGKGNIKIHWSTDQYTVGNFQNDLVPWVDKIVCISPFHKDYYQTHYSPKPEQIGYIDLGVRAIDYERLPTDKVKNQMIWCSVPDRGLKVLAACWPAIRDSVPDASLIITSDYTLWGAPGPLNHNHRMQWAPMAAKGVQFLGKVPRRELAGYQLQSDLTIGSFSYEELFGISMAEGQFAGAPPVSGDMGALPTTNAGGRIIEGDPKQIAWRTNFIDAVIELLTDRDQLATMQDNCRQIARDRFDWEIICDQWETLITEGEFPNDGETE